MSLNFLRLIIICLSFLSINSFALENLVYIWRGFPTAISQGSLAIQDLKAHAAQIDILSSQAYHIDAKGVVFGSLNPQMLEIAKASRLKIMPLLGNSHFDRELAHRFLNDPAAIERAIQAILNLCKQNQFAGIQIDFEGLSFLDRQAFTNFYQKIAKRFHQNGLLIAIALIPTINDRVPETPYQKARFEGWSGVYDYEALGKSSDFVTLMAYDQHGAITPPGPMAGLVWDESLIQYALKYIPAEKISLGIPWHSGYWYTGKNTEGASGGKTIQAQAMDLSFADMTRLLQDNHATLRWDEEDKVHYAIFRNHSLYEYLFVEDAASFSAKLALVKKYKLRGISNWCLGEEDPKIWDLLASRI